MNNLEKILPKGLELQEINFQIPKELNYAGEKSGIKETKEAVLFAVLLGDSLIKSLEDGKIGLSDLPYFFNVVLKLPAALSGIENIPAEIMDLDQDEFEELKEVIRDNVSLNNNHAQILQKSLDLIHSIYQLIIALKQ